jgi:hypothetical protein
MENTLMVTDFAQFYRVTTLEGERFYPNTATNRTAAREHDTAGDPPIVSGYAAYDTAISTEYAVALYSTKTEAEAHEVSKPATAAASIFEECPTGSGRETELKRRKSKPKGRARK